jgi:ParB-like chromosome segregation protein Spo0J
MAEEQLYMFAEPEDQPARWLEQHQLDSVDKLANEIARMLRTMPLAEQVRSLNHARRILHEAGPFRDEPVDFVEWVPAEAVRANDYNPNSVAPPEMELLYVSIEQDGYTQPIVSMPGDDGAREVVDGFHRHRVGKEKADINARINGHLPLVSIRASQSDKADRMAATVRHNRARGKHRVDAMSEMVIELKRRNWSDAKIAKNLGMDQDEVLRLCQLSGIAELFSDEDFSRSWDVDEDAPIDDAGVEDEFGVGAAADKSDGRVFHTWEEWECYPAGFYEDHPPDAFPTEDECRAAYARFLRDDEAFRAALVRVMAEWPNSCAHYLTNQRMNRIAWLGQASVCIAHGIPSRFRGGFNQLSEAEQERANETALWALNKWLRANGREPVGMGEAQGGKVDLY